MPNTLPKLAHFRVTASGHSSNASQLTVFLDNRACATTAREETSHPRAVKIISTVVVHVYSKARTLLARVVGGHYACAYLTAVPPQPPLSLQYARASAPYKVS